MGMGPHCGVGYLSCTCRNGKNRGMESRNSLCNSLPHPRCCSYGLFSEGKNAPSSCGPDFDTLNHSLFAVHSVCYCNRYRGYLGGLPQAAGARSESMNSLYIQLILSTLIISS